jgi:hypothetical protein
MIINPIGWRGNCFMAISLMLPKTTAVKRVKKSVATKPYSIETYSLLNRTGS